jgi:hypothetical protein
VCFFTFLFQKCRLLNIDETQKSPIQNSDTYAFDTLDLDQPAMFLMCVAFPVLLAVLLGLVIAFDFAALMIPAGFFVFARYSILTSLHHVSFFALPFPLPIGFCCCP